MVPSGPPTPIGGGAQSVSPSLLRSNSGLLGGPQAGSLPSQPPFSSLVSPRTQFNSNSLLGNISNVSSLLNQSFGNGRPGSGGGLGTPLSNLQQRGGLGGAVAMVGSAETDPLSFNSSSGPTQGQHFQNPSGNQLRSDRSQPQQLEAGQNLQQQFSVPHSQQQQQQQQLQGGSGNVGNMGPVKLEPHMGLTDQNGLKQQLQTLCSIGAAKMEPQQLQPLRSLGPVKMEPQHADASMFPQQQQQQQQQQYLQLKQSSQAVAARMSLLQQQRMRQLQHQHQQQQQQQQLLKNLPQQRSQLQQQLHQQVLPVRPQVKQATYEPGMCARRLTYYLYHQRHRPEVVSVALASDVVMSGVDKLAYFYS